jgi:hypothetical protein
VGCGGKLKTAPDHCAIQHRDHRHFAKLNPFERPVPGPRVLDACNDVTLCQF